MTYPERLNCDGIYFRVKRGENHMNICLSDLSADERKEILKTKTCDELCRTIEILVNNLRLLVESWTV